MPTDRIEAWLRMRDAARFVRDAYRAGDSVERIGLKARTADAQMRLLNATHDKGMMLLRGLGTAAAYAAGGIALVTGAAASAGLVIGIKFNANMENLTVAFKNFLGTRKATVDYLETLYNIAATTPFEFPELAGAARRFLAFGFSAKETLKILKTTGDAVAGIGGGSDEIQRMVMAFGQMKAKGRVQTEELLQFAELGIPAFQYLKENIGLTGKELQKKLQKGAIDSDTAIEALRKGMDKTFGGASMKQARTFSGQLSTMKDNAQMLLGILSKPAFRFLRNRVLPIASETLNNATAQLRAGKTPIMKRIGGAFETGASGSGGPAIGAMGIFVKLGQLWRKIQPSILKGWGMVTEEFENFLDALKPAKPFWDNVLKPFLIGFGGGLLSSIVTGWKTALVVIKGVAFVLGLLGKAAKPISPIFKLLGFLISFVFGGAILKTIGAVSKFAKILSWPIRMLDSLVSGVLHVIFWFKALRPLFGPLNALSKFLAKRISNLGTVAKILSKILGPMGKFILPLLAKKLKILDTPLSILTRGFRIFRGVVRTVARIIASIIRGLQWLAEHSDILDVFHDAKRNPSLQGQIPRRAGPLPHGAKGGFFSGDFMVGEEGPELARHTPRGTLIEPLNRAGGRPNLAGKINIQTTTYVMLDKKVVAKSTANEVADWRARKGQET